MTNYAHPRCYANSLQDCSSKISGEHIISNNILELFEQNKSIKVTGLPFIEKEAFNLLSRKSLVSNILCTKHNHDISAYDAEAGKLFRSIINFDNDFYQANPTNEHIFLNGGFIEKWMLKIVCGLIAAGHIASGKIRTSVQLNDIYINLLFTDGVWPPHWGLYFKIPENSAIHKYNCAGVRPMTAGNEIKAMEYLINNFKFFLILGHPDQTDHWGIHRLNKLIFTSGTVSKTIEFRWDDPKHNQVVKLTRAGTVTGPPDEWQDWLKK